MADRVKFLAEVVGANCKALRGRIGITQDDLARYAREAGLRWRASSVGDFEAGRSSPTLATTIAVATALQTALDDANRQHKRQADWAVTLGDLLDSSWPVAVTDELELPGRTLARWAGNSPISRPRRGKRDQPEALTDLMRRSVQQPAIAAYLTEASAPRPEDRVLILAVAGCLERAGTAEQRLAKRLGVEAPRLAAVSYRLWRRTFSEERDHRAGPDANAQKRGQVTRALENELRAALAEGGNELLKRLSEGGNNGDN